MAMPEDGQIVKLPIGSNLKRPLQHFSCQGSESTAHLRLFARGDLEIRRKAGNGLGRAFSFVISGGYISMPCRLIFPFSIRGRKATSGLLVRILPVRNKPAVTHLHARKREP